jgi:flagellar motor switch protein FliN/FliY
MRKKEAFHDPLESIDPIMVDAFSTHDDNPEEFDYVRQRSQASNEAVSDIEFPEIQHAYKGNEIETGLFSGLPVQVSVELGRSTISLKEIFELTEGSVVELDRLVGEPLDLVVNGQIIAQGEVVAIDNNFGLRIKKILSAFNQSK